MPLIEELPVNNPIKASHGWAYVPDTGPIAAQQPGTRDRKRAAATTPRHAATSTAKREKATQARLDALNKENYKDTHVPIPPRKSDGKKATANVRRILASQKNFRHYLDEEEAAHPNATHYTLPALATGMAPPATPVATVQHGASGRKGRQSTANAVLTEPSTPVTHTRGTKRGRQTSRSQSISKSLGATAVVAQTDADVKTEDTSAPAPSASNDEDRPADADISMTDAPPASNLPEYPPEWDNDPLLKSSFHSVPPMPSDRVMQLLVSEPPLTYNAARVKPLDEDKHLPPRKFCGVCGYWGRVKCRKCEDYTCGIMECWKDHERICVNANAY